MGDLGALWAIIFLVGMTDGGSGMLTLSWTYKLRGCGDSGGWWGTHDKKSEAVGLSFHETPPRWLEAGGVALMIDLPSILKMRRIRKSIFLPSPCISTSNLPLKFPLDATLLLRSGKRRGSCWNVKIGLCNSIIKLNIKKAKKILTSRGKKKKPEESH